MIKAEVHARHSEELARYKHIKEKKMAIAKMKQKKQAMFTFKKMTKSVNDNIEKENKQQEEETMKLFQNQGLIKNPAAIHRAVQIFGGWLQYKKEEQVHQAQMRNKWKMIKQLAVKQPHRSCTQKVVRNHHASPPAAQKEVGTLRKSSAALNSKPETGKKQQAHSLAQERRIVRRVNDNDEEYALNRQAELAAVYHDGTQKLSQKRRRMPNMLKEALKTEERESVEFQVKLSNLKRQFLIRKGNQPQMDQLNNINDRIQKLANRSSGNDDFEELQDSIGDKSVSKNGEDHLAWNDGDFNTNDEELTTKLINQHAERLQSYQNSLEQLVSQKKHGVNFQKSEPTLQQNVHVAKFINNDSNYPMDISRATGGKSQNEKTRPISMESQNQNAGPITRNATSKAKDSLGHFDESNKNETGQLSRRSLFNFGQSLIIEDQEQKKMSYTGGVTAQGFHERRDRPFMQNRGTHQVQGATKALLSRQFVAKSRNMMPEESEEQVPLIIDSPKKGRLFEGYTSDLTLQHAKSERKHFSGRNLGIQSQANQTKKFMPTKTLQKSENRQMTTMERKNSLNETITGTAQTISQTQTGYNQYAQNKLQSSNNLRPISAQPFIKSKGYKIKEMQSQHHLETEEQQDTQNSDGFVKQNSQTEAYQRLASRTKQVFEQSLTADWKTGTDETAKMAARGQTLNYDHFKDRHRSQFTMTVKNPTGFGSSLRTSLYTINQRTVPDQVFDQDTNQAIVTNKEKKNLVKDLCIQLQDLQAINKLYREQLQIKRNSSSQNYQLGGQGFKNSMIKTKYSDQNKSSKMDLQELFFDCAYQAIKLRTKRQSNAAINMSHLNNELSPLSVKNLIPKSIEEKTNALLKFVTNRHVLQVLYDVMFKFQKVQTKVIQNHQDHMSHHFIQELFRVNESDLTSPMARNSSLPNPSNDTKFNHIGKPRYSRNLSPKQSNILNITNWNISDLDQRDESKQFTQTVPSAMQETLTREEARKLALYKLNQKQKQDLQKLRNQVVQMQLSKVANKRWQIPSNLSGDPKQFSENSLLQTKLPLNLQAESLARNASDISHTQVIVLSQKTNANNAADETSNLKNTTDEATAVIDNHLITKDSQTMQNAMTLQEQYQMNKQLSFSGEKLPAVIHETDEKQEALSLSNKKKNERRVVQTALLSMNQSNFGPADSNKQMVSRVTNKFEQVKPIEVQINKNWADQQKSNKKSSQFGGNIRSKGSIIVSDSHFQDRDISNERILSKISNRPSSGKAYSKKNVKKMQIGEAAFKTQKVNESATVDQVIKQNIENSRQRQIAIMNAMSLSIEGNQTSTPALAQQVYGQQIQINQGRPRSFKSSVEIERPSKSKDRQAKQSATLEFTRPRLHQESRTSIDVEINNSSSLNENTRMKRRSIQLNISNMNRRIQKLNRFDEQEMDESDSHEDDPDSKAQEELIEFTEKLSPGIPMQPKTESITLGSPQKNKEKGSNGATLQYTHGPIVETDQLNVDLAHIEEEQRANEMQKAELLLPTKDATMYISQPQFPTLDDRPYFDQCIVDKQDHKSSKPDLEDSKEYTDFREKKNERSDVSPEQIELNQTSQIQQIVAPISSVQIANIGPQGASQHAEIISYLSGYNSKQMNSGTDMAVVNKHRKKISSNFQTINSVSVKNVEQAVPVNKPPKSGQQTISSNYYQVKQFDQQQDDLATQVLNQQQQPQQATIISTGNLLDITTQFRVPTPPLSGFKRIIQKPRSRPSRPSTSKVDMLQNLKHVDKQVRSGYRQTSSKQSVRTKR